MYVNVFVFIVYIIDVFDYDDTLSLFPQGGAL